MLMRLIRHFNLTKLTGLFILIVIVSKVVSNEGWKGSRDVINGDVRGYYAYLPALLINDDLKFDDLEVYKMKNPGYHVWTSEAEDGTRFVKYTCGMAMMYSPFFIVANSVAEPLGAKADGFSYPYRIALIISSLFYMLIGVVFLTKFLKRYFSDHVVSIALIILFLGTNLFQYETKHLTYSHGYSFALISLFMYASVCWLDKQKIKWAIWMGLSAGLLVLIRPIDILFLSLVVLFGVSSFDNLKDRFSLLWKHKLHVILFVACAFLMIIPQLLYFKYISGSFIFYSYDEESFFFLKPHLYDTLFSFRNGWLIYSPIMVFSIFGLFFVRKKAKEFTWFMLLIPILYYYVISSWWCWWYAGFGNRAFINLYPLLAISLCAFIVWVQSKNRISRWVFNGVIIYLIGLNAFQNYQFEKGIIHWGYMSKDAYVDAWGRSETSQLQSLYLHVPDLQKAKQGRDVVSVPNVNTIRSIKNSFEHVTKADSNYYIYAQSMHPFTGEKSLYYPENTEYIANTKFKVPKNATHIYVSYKLRRNDAVLAVLQGDNHPYYFLSGDIMDLGDGWEKMELFAKLPKERPDIMNFYIWNKGLHEMFLDDLEIEILNFAYKDIEY